MAFSPTSTRKLSMWLRWAKGVRTFSAPLQVCSMVDTYRLYSIYIDYYDRLYNMKQYVFGYFVNAKLPRPDLPGVKATTWWRLLLQNKHG